VSINSSWFRDLRVNNFHAWDISQRWHLRFYISQPAQTTDTIACQKSGSWDRVIQYYKWIEGFTTWKIVVEWTSYLLPLASKTSFTEWYGKPSQAPPLICLTCCAILACSKVGTWD
jgi:hypothetical protein